MKQRILKLKASEAEVSSFSNKEISGDITVTFYDIRELIKSHHYSFVNENELQNGIEEVLKQYDRRHKREYSLSRTDRIDFLLDCNVGIEVKIQGSLSALVRQVHRYMHYEEIDVLIIVTDKLRLCNLPEEINGKPVCPIYIANGCW